MKSRTNNELAIGFISALQCEGAWLGGLLLTDSSGKPIEFHCTAPVKATQPHQVLYGPTLDSFVLADNVAPKLIAAVKTEPAIICTDLIEMTASAAGNGVAVLVVSPESNSATSMSVRVYDEQINELDHGTETQQEDCLRVTLNDRQLRRLESLDQFAIGQQKFAIEKGSDSQRHELISQLKQFATQFDLSEPFERIQIAIQQSHGIKSSQEAA